MTKIDFHILASHQDIERLQYVARLVMKAQARGHDILIACASAEQSKAVSQALWAARADAFLAHTEIDQAAHSLQLSHTDDCGTHHDILINLCEQVPSYFSRFIRVFEVVSQQPDLLESSRARYRYYQDRGYELNRHDLRQRMPQ
ncbi:DNA polymerase III subunit chi [Reinekea thalattae]|uniref:DNA polymerase III subunit chi n=1 Tax=Reinekea thalattae TaxID=2593301 RepID=A0A5C8Z818_9GAMM|nr:DNA polymerase III subunit chi [Reinekea thalattae]TXR53797.1 DNA polymerase III subunit chi [Reinekea thalattae]